MQNRKRGAQIHAHYPIPIGFGQINDRLKSHDTRVVDENLDAAPLFDDVIDHALHIGALRNVGVEINGRAAVALDLRDGLTARLAVDVNDGDARALAGELKAGRQADARSAAGDNGDVIGKIHGKNLVAIQGINPQPATKL